MNETVISKLCEIAMPSMWRAVRAISQRQEQINTAKLGASRFLLSEMDIYLFLGLECLGEMPHLLSIRPGLGDAVRRFLLQ